jgi:hypothetical protein
MALEVFVGSFRSLTTDTASVTTYTLSPGFLAKAGIVFHTGRGDATDAQGLETHRTSIGFFTSTSNRFVCGTMSVHNAAAGSGNEFARNDGVVASYTTDTGTLDGRIDINSITSTDCIFRIEDVMPVDTTVGVILYGGSDITNAIVVENHIGATGTGAINVTNVGFQGTVLFLMGVDEITNAPVADGLGGQLTFGACTGAGDEHVLWNGMDQGSATSDTGGYHLAGEIYAMASGSINSPVASMPARIEFTQWVSNGFDLNKLANDRASRRFYSLVIQGGNWTVGDFTTLTTVSTITEGSLGYNPKSVLIVSGLHVVDTSPASVADARISIGAAAGSVDHAQAYSDSDGDGNMIVGTAVEFNAVYVNVSVGANPQTLDGLISLQSFGTGEFVLSQDDADPTANYAWYVACGAPAPAGGAAPLMVPLQMRGPFIRYKMPRTAPPRTPSIFIAYTLVIDAGSYAVTGTLAALLKGSKLLIDAGSYAVTGTAAALLKGFKVLSDAGSYVITGTAANLEYARLFAADAGSYLITGTAASLEYARLFAAEAGSYLITGTAAALLYGRKLAIDAGSYLITGTAASLLKGSKLLLDAGSYIISGTAATLSKGRTLVIEAGSYIITGTSATLLATRKLLIDAGSYLITGAAVGLLKGRTLLVEAGSYVLTGTAATLLAARKLLIGAGSYAVTGTTAALLAGRRLVSDAGSYLLTGTAATLRATRKLAIDAGAYVVAGSSAALLAGRRLSLGAGSYVTTGTAAALLAFRRLSAASGVYAIVGFIANLFVGSPFTLYVPWDARAHITTRPTRVGGSMAATRADITTRGTEADL